MRLALLSLIFLTGCLTPRSVGFGQMASAVGPGATEIGVMSGFMYASQTSAPVQTKDTGGAVTTSQTTTRGFSIPAFEANIQQGFTQHVGLNLHTSSAGLQPGLKFTVTNSKVIHFALLPSIAFGYGSNASSLFTAGGDGRLSEVNPSTQTSFTFLTGIKFIFSHNSGFYMGVGYDFLYQRSFTSTVVGALGSQDKSETLVTAGHHQLAAAAGFNITLGLVRIRPEIAFSITPGIATTTASAVGANMTNNTVFGGSSWAIFPGFTFAIATPAKAKSGDDETDTTGATKLDDTESSTDSDDEAVKSRPARQNADDEEESPKRYKKKATKRASDDEESN